MRVNPRLGVLAGFVATVAALPFLSSKHDTSVPKPDTSPQVKEKTIGESDREFINSILNTNNPDIRLQELNWARAVHLTIRERLMSLYRAEVEDLNALREGKISPKERKVKIAITDFVRPGEDGDDMGAGSKLHVVRSFDEKLPNGKLYRTYVNVHLPINEKTGAIHPADGMRIKAQVFGNGIEDLYKPDAEQLFISDRYLVAWGRNTPYFARQHFYGDFDPVKKSNDVLQTEEIISVPNSCYFCHEVSRYNAHSKHIFKDPNVNRINYGAITQDYVFDLPVSEQLGYKRYMTYLGEKVKRGELTDAAVKRISTELTNTANLSLETPLMLAGLEKTSDVPWLEGDEKATENDKATYRYTYKDGKETWTRRIYPFYSPNIVNLSELQLIPKKN